MATEDLREGVTAFFEGREAEVLGAMSVSDTIRPMPIRSGPARVLVIACAEDSSRPAATRGQRFGRRRRNYTEPSLTVPPRRTATSPGFRPS